MGVTISGRIELLKPNHSLQAPSPPKSVYLIPSRTDFQFSIDSGTTWQNWQGDPNLASTYPGGIQVTAALDGTWSVALPWTDDPTECQLPVASPTPALKWNIIDPNPTTGRLVFTGETPAAIVGSTKTIQQLTALAPPNTWTVSGVTYRAVPIGPRRFQTLSFTTSSIAALSMDDIGTNDWKFGYGIESDAPSSNYTLTLDTASKTSTAGSFYLSDVPPAGKTVKVHIEVYL